MAGEPPKEVTFRVGANQLGLVDADGNTRLVAGVHTVLVSTGDGYSHSFPVTVQRGKELVAVPRCKNCPR